MHNNTEEFFCYKKKSSNAVSITLSDIYLDKIVSDCKMTPGLNAQGVENVYTLGPGRQDDQGNNISVRDIMIIDVLIKRYIKAEYY